MAQVRVTPSGIMDKDTDLAYVSQGNYVDGNDIRHRDTSGQNFGGIMPIVGNDLKITLASYSTTSRSYQIFIDIDDIVSSGIADHSGTLYLTFPYPPGGPIAATYSQSLTYSSTVIATVVSSVQTAFSNLATAAGGTFSYGTVTYSGNKAQFTLTLASGLSGDFILFEESTRGQIALLKEKTEYINVSGDFTVVGSVQLDSDLFVFLAGDDFNSDGTSQVSEIGIIRPSGSGYVYSRVLRASSLRFHRHRNIEAEIERNGAQINLYWTDNLNKPRVLYIPYSNRYTTDCVLYANGGKYDFFNLDKETSLFFPKETAYIDQLEVIEGEGSVTSGNKRYTGRFLTEDYSKGDFFFPSGLVNIYSSKTDKPHEIKGDRENTQSGKSVRMKVKNFTPGVYKYFELVVIEYVENAFSASIVQRYTIDENADELDVAHTNIGQTLIPLSFEELNTITLQFSAAKSLKLFDGRLLLSNLKERIYYDLSAWSQTIKHSIEQTYIESIGIVSDDLTGMKGETPAYKYGEYQNPNYVNQRVGYFYNDTYRFGVQVQWKDSGQWSDVFWVDDIRIDASSTNVIGTRRLTSIGGVDTNLQDSSNNRVKTYYVKFRDINLNYAVDTNGNGVGDTLLKDLISSFRFVRSERIPEVIATGMFFAGVRSAFGSGSNPIAPFPGFKSKLNGSSLPEGSRENATYGSSGNLHLGYSTTATIETLLHSWTATDESDFLFFYSPDLYYNQGSYEKNALDKIRLLPTPPKATDIYSGYVRADQLYAEGSNVSTYLEYGGFVSGAAYSDFTISDHASLGIGGKTPLSTYTVNNRFDYGNLSVISARYKSSGIPCEVFKLSSKVQATLTTSNGIYYGQVYRDLGANKKYPANKSESVYESTNHLYIITDQNVGTISQDVYGGDCFTQKTILPFQMMEKADYGGGIGFGFYSQNALNTQMFYVEEYDNTDSGYGYKFPQYVNPTAGGKYFVVYLGSTNMLTFTITSVGANLFYWLEQWPEITKQNNYNSAYTPKDGTILSNGYFQNETYNGELPTRIIWSARKILGSNRDDYRFFESLSFSDLDLTKGEISSHEIINGNLYTWQEHSFQRQYFREGTVVNSQTGSDIVLGSSSIMGVPGVEITSIGCSKKWSIVKGKTQQGKEVAYWYNDRLQKFLRFAQDGINIISDRGLSSYFFENGKFVINEQYPLSGKGVHGIWNDKYQELIYTFKYTEGASNKQFTIVFDEIKNGFICFHSYYPNLYLRYNNTFFSPNPSNQKQLYLHDSGSETTYYGSYVTPSITAVMNYEPNLIKNYEALLINADKSPYDVNFTTKNHISFLDETDFDKREDLFYSPIKNDSTLTSVNNGDTSRLWGYWLKVRLSLETIGGKQKLRNFIVKFRPMPRLFNQ
jgi:hypothetical protein